MVCVCVGDVMDVVFSVCIVRRRAVGEKQNCGGKITLFQIGKYINFEKLLTYKAEYIPRGIYIIIYTMIYILKHT